MLAEEVIIALDFDGVLHSAPKRYDGKTDPSGPPVEGALSFCRVAAEQGYRLVVFSTRVALGDVRDRVAVGAWLREHGFRPYIQNITGQKVHAHLYVDDRGYRFDGSFGALTAFLLKNPKPGRWEKGSDV